ncbi:hypothetical protein LIA77_11968 [Sarocladium implicatum]|nr:hypothetical protein LIA77_11968 [Sarocladium implicatum]
MDARREQRRQMLERRIDGRDVVSWCLQDPHDFQDDPPLRGKVLGRHFFPPDQCDMINHFSGGWNASCDHIVGYAAKADHGSTFVNIELWKLAYCDVAAVANKTELDQLYEDRLRDEELQPREEQARELIRSEEEKTARRNAKWMIPALEQLDPHERKEMQHALLGNRDALLAIWKQVSPPPPQWVQTIIENKQSWGFACYKTPEAQRQYGSGDAWKQTWKAVTWNAESTLIDLHGPRRDLSYTNLSSVHCWGNVPLLAGLETQLWPQDDEAVGELESDDDFRGHFAQYSKTIASVNILRNTFIVVDSPTIAAHLDEDDIHYQREVFAVWAYDATWHPPTDTEAAQSPERAEQRRLGYRGRVRVSYFSLGAWFYAARAADVSLYDMWRKAEREPDRMWHGCSKYLEGWDHEPFT